MQFQEKFNEVCKFPDSFEFVDDINKEIEMRIRTFNEKVK